ncbi:MAG: hypothetical protein WC947_10315 [Elusimicrobiota bacterium]
MKRQYFRDLLMIFLVFVLVIGCSSNKHLKNNKKIKRTILGYTLGSNFNDLKFKTSYEVSKDTMTFYTSVTIRNLEKKSYEYIESIILDFYKDVLFSVTVSFKTERRLIPIDYSKIDFTKGADQKQGTLDQNMFTNTYDTFDTCVKYFYLLYGAPFIENSVYYWSDEFTIIDIKKTRTENLRGFTISYTDKIIVRQFQECNLIKKLALSPDTIVVPLK